MWKPMHKYMSLLQFISANMDYCILLGMYLAVIYLRLFDIVIRNENSLTKMILIDRVMFMCCYFISGGIAILDDTANKYQPPKGNRNCKIYRQNRQRNKHKITNCNCSD